MSYKMDNDLKGDVARRFIGNVLSDPADYPDDDVDLAEDVKSVLEQNQKLIEALEEIAELVPPQYNYPAVKIAQQALDEVNAQKE